MSIVTADPRRFGSPSSVRTPPPSLLMVATVPETLETLLLPLAKHFRRQGWRVDAMARQLSGSSSCVAAFHRCHDIPWSRNPLDPRNLFRAAGLARKLIEAESYDLVHVHTPVAGFVTRLALRKQQAGVRPRVIYTAHGFRFYRGGSFLKNYIFRMFEKMAGRWTDALVVMNREDDEAARVLRIVPSGRVTFMPGVGLDTAQYLPGVVLPEDVARLRNELKLPPAEALFLMAAEFIPRKRHEDVLHALSRLSTRHAHLLLTGSGPLQEELHCLSVELGLQDRVHFLGIRRDLPVLLRASKALILASEYEDLPHGVIEAMCMETPVIGTRIRGIEDLLEDECGLMMEKGDRSGLAWAMGQVLDDPEGARDMAVRARAKMDRYDLKNILQLHESLYRDVLSSS